MPLLERLGLTPPLKPLADPHALARAAGAAPGTATDADVDGADLRSLSVRPKVATLGAGEALQFSAEGIDAIGDPIDLSFDVEWTSSSPSAVTVDATGRATGHPVSGRAIVTATHRPSGKRASAVVTTVWREPLGPKAAPKPATPTPMLKSLLMVPGGGTISVDGSLQLSVTGIYSDGGRQDETLAVRWESSAPAICEVDAQGRVYGRRAGQATVRAIEPNSGISARAAIDVGGAFLTGTRILPERPSVHAAGLLQLQVVADYSDGTTTPLQGAVAWRSSDPDIVSVNPTGSLVGRNQGFATLTATYDGTDLYGRPLKTTASVRVEVPHLVKLSIESASLTLRIGEQRRLVAMGGFSDGSKAEVLVPTWTSGDTRVVAFDSRGQAVGRGAGSAVVTATVKDHPGVIATARVEVQAAALESIELVFDTPADFAGTLERGRRLHVRAVGVYPLGSGKSDRRELSGVAWSSSDAKIASVGKDGVVAALAPGRASIDAEDPASGVNVSFTLRVVESGAAAPDPKGLPADVVDPYLRAKKSYEALHAQVRELDGVPQLVKSLKEIVADLGRAEKDSVQQAQMIEMQSQQAKGIDLQIRSFTKSADSASQHIARCDAALADFDGRQEVKALRAQGKEQMKNIKFVISLVKAGAKAKDPIGAGIELVSGLIDRFETSAYDQSADELEKKLDDTLRKAIGTELAQARKDLADAHEFLGNAQKLAGEAGLLLERLRDQAEETFDRSARAGSFRFSELTRPLHMADRIADELAPQVADGAGAAASAIERLRDRSGVDRDSPAGRRLHAMHEEAIGWASQANVVRRQADAQRKELRSLREQADKALAFVKPGAAGR